MRRTTNRGVFAGFYHAGQPVDGGIGGGAAQRLDEGGDGVVVRLAGAVVQVGAVLERLFDELAGHLLDAVFVGPRRRRRQLEGVEGDARVAAGAAGQRLDRFVVERQLLAAKPALLVGQRPADYRLDLLRRQEVQRVDAGARQQRPDDLERRVLRRGADERDRAVFDVRQDDVLLRLVKAVDLVDEKDCALSVEIATLTRLGDDASQVADTGGHGGDRLEVRLRLRGDDAGERRLAAAGRAPEDH